MKPLNLSFGNVKDPLPLAVTALGALILAGTLLYIVLVPAPTPKGLVARTRTKEREIQNKIGRAKERRVEIETILTKRKSILPPDAIGSDALARMTKLAKAGNLKLTAFRPQRTTDSPSGVTLYPYQMTLEGTFPGVAKFVRTVERTTDDLAVTLVGLASAEGPNGAVTATVGIVTFRDTPKPPKKAAPKTTGVTNGR